MIRFSANAAKLPMVDFVFLTPQQPPLMKKYKYHSKHQLKTRPKRPGST
jgi:hypothetical protein